MEFAVKVSDSALTFTGQSERLQAMEMISQQFDVRGIRRACYMSIENLAQALGVSARTVSRWEHGEHEPQGRHLRKLADFVEIEQPEIGVD